MYSFSKDNPDRGFIVNKNGDTVFIEISVECGAKSKVR